MKLGPRVRKVRPEPGHRLLLTFTNGEKKVYDVSPLLGQGVFRELKDKSAFFSVRPWHGTVQWAGGQDLCPDTLYEDSVAVGAAISSVRESRASYGTDKADTGAEKKKAQRRDKKGTVRGKRNARSCDRASA